MKTEQCTVTAQQIRPDLVTFAIGVVKGEGNGIGITNVFVNNNHVGSESVSGAVMRFRAVWFGFRFGFYLTANHGIRSRIQIQIRIRIRPYLL